MGFQAAQVKNRGSWSITSLFRALAKLVAPGLAVLIFATPPASSVSQTNDLGVARASNVPAVPADNVCGINSLFMLLRSWGYEFSPNEVRRVITPRSDGSSMQELKAAAKAHWSRPERFSMRRG